MYEVTKVLVTDKISFSEQHESWKNMFWWTVKIVFLDLSVWREILIWLGSPSYVWVTWYLICVVKLVAVKSEQPVFSRPPYFVMQGMHPTLKFRDLVSLE